MRDRVKLILAFFITALFLFAAAYYSLTNDFTYAFSVGYFFWGLLFVFVGYFFRTIRFALFFKDIHVDVRIVFITMLHGSLNYFLPVKSGELSFLYLTKRSYGVLASRSLAVLLFVRFSDLAFVLFSFFFILCFYSLDYHSLGFSAGKVFSLFLGSFLVFLSLFFFAKRFAFVREVHADLATLLRSLGVFRFFSFLLLTIFVWSSGWAAFYSFAVAAGYSMSLLDVVSVSLILVPLAFLPVQGFANVGSYETAWVLVLAKSTGLAAAMEVAVSTHIQFTICMAAVGLTGFLCFPVRRLLKGQRQR